jgi:hypothetical protein
MFKGRKLGRLNDCVQNGGCSKFRVISEFRCSSLNLT